ncbi:MAG: hypothetical protein HC866_01865 [Leptolyngbyaceae cyanobacterium RU_5_1]|nr:hypothetical protein [Leptolyngbyaceae cyanobacterium RU_5_1]
MTKNYALVIGINQYTNLQSLRFAKRDAELMQAFFKQEARFDQVFYFSDNSPEILPYQGSPIQTRPTYGNLRYFLRAQFDRPFLSADDNFWFFFSGHGNRYADRDYLMPSDSDLGSIEHTAISINYLTERLRRCGANNVVMVLDACRSEGRRSGVGISNEGYRGIISIYACRPNESSYEIEHKDIQQGAFTYVLLQALRNQLKGSHFNIEQLDEYLRRQVKEINSKYGKPVQTPAIGVESITQRSLVLLSQFKLINQKIPKADTSAQCEQSNLENRQYFTYTLIGHQNAVRVVNFSPDGINLASCSNEEIVKIWDLKTRQSFDIEAGSNYIYSIAFSANNRFLATGGLEEVIDIWDLQNWEHIYSLKDSGVVTSMSFTPDNRLLISGCTDSKIRVWNLEIRERKSILSGHSGAIQSLAISPDGKLLVSGSDDNKVKLWNLETGKSVRTFFHKNKFGVNSVAFSHDGQLIASGSHDKTVKIWGLESSQPLSILDKFTDAIHAVVFSPNDQLLICGTNDKKVQVWNISNINKAKLVHDLEGHTGCVSSVAISPDGETLASGSSDRTIRIWKGYLSQDFGGKPPTASQTKLNTSSPNTESERQRFESVIKALNNSVLPWKRIDLKEDQKAILWGAWRGKTYAVIASETNHSSTYLRRIAQELWERLSARLGERVDKDNFRKLIEKRFDETS